MGKHGHHKWWELGRTLAWNNTKGGMTCYLDAPSISSFNINFEREQESSQTATA